MGCGASKQQLDKLNAYKQKLEELMQINDKLSKQIAELKDLKNLRKPIYIIKDQETEDLTKYKEELERKFQSIEMEILRVNKQLQIQVKVDQKRRRKTNKPIDLEDIVDEEEWKKNLMNDNDITVKPFEEALIDIEQNQDNQDEKDSQSGLLQIDSQLNIKNQIAKEQQENNDKKSQPEKKITIKIENNLQQNIENEVNNGQVKEKRINSQNSQLEQQQQQDAQIVQNLKSDEIEININESMDIANQSPDNQLSTLPKRKKQTEIKKQQQNNTNNQNQSAEQQLFFTKQRNSVSVQQKNSKNKYQL